MNTKVWKRILPVALGAAAGFAYWYFIGCINGSCPITSSWYTSTAYGAIIGATFLFPGKKSAGKHVKGEAQRYPQD